MPDPSGTRDGNGNSINSVAFKVAGVMLMAWAGWLTVSVLNLQATVPAGLESAHRRIDGIAVVLAGFCKPSEK